MDRYKCKRCGLTHTVEEWQQIENNRWGEPSMPFESKIELGKPWYSMWCPSCGRIWYYDFEKTDDHLYFFIEHNVK